MKDKNGAEIKVCEFGTAPEQQKEGYYSTGIELYGYEDEVLTLLSKSEGARLVKSEALPDDYVGESYYFLLSQSGSRRPDPKNIKETTGNNYH